MGAWGTSLYANDTTSDVRGDYLDKLRRGKTNEEATRELIDENQSIMGNEEEEPLFWFALADIQWNYGRLLPPVKEKALEFLEKDGDITVWKESAKKKDYEAWLQIREKLKEKLLMPQPALKKVYKYRTYHCKWKVGDVYAYRFDSEYSKQRGFYGKYMVFRKTGEARSWPPTIIIPVVQIYEWIGDQIPDLKQVMAWKKYLRNESYLGYRARKIEKKFRGYEEEYYTRFHIETTSERVIPKSQLTYIGNIYGDEDKDQVKNVEAINYLGAYPLYWQKQKSNFRIEEEVINLYLSWTLPEPQSEGSSFCRRLKGE